MQFCERVRRVCLGSLPRFERAVRIPPPVVEMAGEKALDVWIGDDGVLLFADVVLHGPGRILVRRTPDAAVSDPFGDVARGRVEDVNA